MARPKNNTVKLQIWVTEAVDAWVGARSLAVGLSKSEYVRTLIAREIEK